MIEELVKSGVGTVQTPKFSKAQVDRQFGGPSQGAYPTGNDDPENRDREAAVHVSGQMSEEAEEVFFDASLLDAKVREQIQAAGANYNFKRAVENGTLVKMPRKLWEAFQRIQINIPILRRAIVAAMTKESHHHRSPESIAGDQSGSASGGVSGRTTGSPSGSVSGSESGQVSKTTVVRAMQGFQDDALTVMGRR